MQMLSLAEQFLSHYQWTVALTSYQDAIPWPDDVLFNDCVPGFNSAPSMQRKVPKVSP